MKAHLFSVAAVLLLVSAAPARAQCNDAPVAPETTEAHTVAQTTSTPAAAPDDTAEDIWVASCAMCHGRDGSAKTWLGKRNKVRDLTDPRWQASVDDARIVRAIRDGVPNSRMRAFAAKMSGPQLEAVATWVRSRARPAPALSTVARQ